MSQAATADQTASDGFDSVQSAWRRNLEAGAEAARAFQAENAEFAGRLLDLNLQAARSFADPDASADRFAAPFQLGASAVELYFGYLGRSVALAQQAIILPWKNAKDRC